MTQFVHLHVHTQYSILDGEAKIKPLLAKAKEYGMNSLAITDHGNMYGVLEFFEQAQKVGIKPLLGCEMYVAKGSRFERNGKDFSGHHLILIAKNQTGYQNLIKLDSLAFDKNAFYRTVRIDKEILFQHNEGLICSSACLGGEIPQLIMNNDIAGAEKSILEFREVFGEDYYLELQNHGRVEQQEVNKQIVQLANKHGIKLIATNDVHFIDAEDFEAHKILICLNTGKKLSEYNAGKLQYTGEEYLKSPNQMAALFPDNQDAIANTQEIADKVQEYELHRDPILPVFDIPKDFGTIEDYYAQYPPEKVQKEYTDEQIKKKGGYDKIVRTKFDYAYLRYLTFNGAKKRYGQTLSDELKERIEFELSTIYNMGFPGYFLIVQDFINTAQEKLNVIVGPGRGSAAGSVVAYCLKITDIDPIRYGLLFERFLNPDRISLPDIDVDFDDEGRAKVLEYVQQRYGADHVAQIITFGTMAAKNAIRNVARVLDLPLAESNRLSKLLPDKPGTTLATAYTEVPELKEELDKGSYLVKETLKYAQQLEGTVNNIGTHACGTIIGPDDLTKYIPLASAKGSTTQMVTQYEGHSIEGVGMIKMDFLGLKTLSILKDACENVYKRNGITLNLNNVPLDDKDTFSLFQRGDTIGLFQFESEGMRSHMEELKPDRLEDLIALNALYRPGPMQYIPNYIARKHGKEKVEYAFPEIMGKYLDETYGITVYQEQVMQLSQAMAGFTKGQADKLRKAMGKKKKDVMAEMKEKFMVGCQGKGLDEDAVTKIWSDWEKFAEYAFNKSHATCYAFLAYRTGYLKVHYPAEFMASVLTHNLNEIKNITIYIKECTRMKIPVLGPSVNDSDLNFMVNEKGEIHYGLAAVKSVGAKAAEEIIAERKENGKYLSPFEFIRRLSLRATTRNSAESKDSGISAKTNTPIINKKCIESLVQAGAFDCFEGINRAQYFQEIATRSGASESFIEKLVRYGNQYKDSVNSSQQSLFGSAEQETIDCEPTVPECAEWNNIDKLNRERESIGFYISGHPLDKYAKEQQYFANTTINELEDNMESLENKSLYLMGIISSPATKLNKKGNPYGKFVLEDKSASMEFALFGDDYTRFHNFMVEGYFVFVKAVVKRRMFGGDEAQRPLSIRILDIERLDNVFENHVAGLKLNILADKLDSDLYEKIFSCAKSAKGTQNLSFLIKDTESNVSITLKAKKHKVDVLAFIESIEDMILSRQIYSYDIIKKNM